MVWFSSLLKSYHIVAVVVFVSCWRALTVLIQSSGLIVEFDNRFRYLTYDEKVS